MKRLSRAAGLCCPALASALALALAVALPAPALAAQEDGHGWAAATATIPVSERTVVWLEGQVRFYDEGARLGQILLRPGVGYRLGATETAFLGYAYVRTDQLAGPHTQEHRIWQQLSFRASGDGKGVTVTGRTRLEERFMKGSGDMGFRLRQQVRVTAPLGGKVRAVAWGEGFAVLDDTAWGQRRGFDRLRSFAGIAVPISARASLEPGYLNEWISQRRAADRVNHIASVTISTSF